MGLYERIKTLAKEKGYSINRLEKELGFARSSISKFNTNKPSIDKIQQIAELLGVSVDSITCEDQLDIQIVSKRVFTDADIVSLFSGSEAVLKELLGDMLEKEQMAEFTKRVNERLPKDFGMPKTSALAAHFDGDEFTESELEEIKQFAEFVKNRKK